MQQQKVHIPIDSMKCLRSSPHFGEEKYRFIQYLDSSTCVPCAIRQLSTWSPIIQEFNDNGNLISLYIIVETKEPQLIEKLERKLSEKVKKQVFFEEFFKKTIEKKQNLFYTTIK